MVKAKWISASFALLILMATTGCWDRAEIEDIGIVLGIGIDKPVGRKVLKREEIEEKGQKQKLHRLSMTHHFAVPREMVAKQATGKQKAYVNLINEGTTVFEIIRELSTRIARPPNYEHLKVIVISEQIARSIDLRDIVNFLLRNPESRRTVKVVISKGQARDAFNIPPPIIANPALKLAQLTENTKKTLRMPPELTLGDMSEKLTGQNSFVVQRVVNSEKESKIAGAAVIKGRSNKMIGWLGEDEVEGLNWVTGKGKAGIIKGIDKKTQEVMIYEMRKMKSSIKPTVKGDQISFTVEIETEGSLREDWEIPGNAFEEDLIKRAEKATKEEIKVLAKKALDKTQKDFKVDVGGFGKQLSIHYPKVWKKVKKDWDEKFSEVPVEVNVKVHIREFGTRGTKM